MEVLDAAQALLPELRVPRWSSPTEDQVAAVMGQNQSLMMALGKTALIGPSDLENIGRFLADTATSAVQGLMMLSPADFELEFLDVTNEQLHQRAELFLRASIQFRDRAGAIIGQTDAPP
ncbi:hypothetical protein [Streptomyces sp. NPDC054962]